MITGASVVLPASAKKIEERLRILIDAIDARVTVVEGGGGGGGGGVTDHGALTVLGDDDHSQYHNDSRGDARYSPLGHTHTGVYSPVGHTHAASFFDDYSSASTTGTGIAFTNSYKTAENLGAANSCQLISHQFFGGDGGKYYFEILVDTAGTPGVGVTVRREAFAINSSSYVGALASSFAYWYDGLRYTGGVSTAGYSTWTTGDVIGVAVDAAAGKIWFSKNGTWQGGGDPAAGTSPAYTSDYLKRQLHAHCTPYATNAKQSLRGLSSEVTGSIPSGFWAAFD